MSTKQEFVNILEDFHEKAWGNQSSVAELSGWSENPVVYGNRKGIQSEENSRFKIRIGRKKGMERLRNSIGTAGGMIRKSKDFREEGVRYKKITQHLVQFDALKYLDRRNNMRVRPFEDSGFQIKAIPLIHKETHKRSTSLVPERKKKSRIDMADKKYLVVEKSPPTISGNSVIFYYK